MKNIKQKIDKTQQNTIIVCLMDRKKREKTMNSKRKETVKSQGKETPYTEKKNRNVANDVKQESI